MKLDRSLIRKVADYVKHGVPIRPAGVACGIETKQLQAWIDKGFADDEQGRKNLHVEFVQALEKAKAEFTASQRMILTKAAVGYRKQDGSHQEGDWKAAQLALQASQGDDELEVIRRLTTW